MTGYMSGLNAANASPGADPLAKVNSSDQIFAWMDNYCGANPLKFLSDGAQALYAELTGRK
ncbi:MAG: hypothetical protein INH13_09990 [Cupriavidus sp.]|nr:hypothetical protein [Cupriavidus sp.]